VRRIVLLCALGATLAAAFMLLRASEMKWVFGGPPDFIANRCATVVALHGGNPYTVEPLRSCEAASEREVEQGLSPGRVIPAVLPPYAFVLLAPVMLLPLTLAAPLWQIVQVLACGLAAVYFQRVYRGSVIAYVAVILVSSAQSLILGQTDLPVLLATVGAAFALRRGPPLALGPLLAYALVKPQFSLPPLASLIASAKAERRVLLGTAAILTAIALAVPGLRACLMYAFEILPAHARAELDVPRLQFAFAAVLRTFGLDVAACSAINTAVYLLAAIFAIVVARGLAARTGESDWLVFLPAGIAVFSATFMHPYDLVLALPLLFLIAHTAATLELPVVRGVAWASAAVLALIAAANVLGFASGVPAHRSAALAAALLALPPDAPSSRASEIFNAALAAPSPEGAALLAAMKLAVLAVALITVWMVVRIARRAGVRFGEKG
jgi:hypothetical protein